MNIKDYVDIIFSEMLEDINYIKLMTLFCTEEPEEIEVLM